MAISANTLFHFTGSQSLKSILLSQGFFAQYSDEHFEDILPAKSIYRISRIPLISFCDLTVMQLAGEDSLHRKNYGEYGIGLTKEWGIANKISPVIYVHKNSLASNQLYGLIRTFSVYLKQHEGDNNSLSEVKKQLVDFFKYIKPHKGDWHKGKKQSAHITYYNEREWRYSPDRKPYKVLSGIRESNIRLRDTFNKLLKKKLIKFSPEDVKFIIVKDRTDINSFIEAIKKMKIAAKRQNELITKIMTFEEIRDDF